MDELLYRVVFEGNLTGEYELRQTKKRFAKMFRLDDTRVEKLFSGNAVVLKNNVSEDIAMEYAIKITEAGCECIIESMPDPGDISQDPSFVERRKTVRRKRFRREPRPGAIVPDRRKVASLRKMDLIMLEKYGDFPGKTIPNPGRTKST